MWEKYGISVSVIWKFFLSHESCWGIWKFLRLQKWQISEISELKNYEKSFFLKNVQKWFGTIKKISKILYSWPVGQKDSWWIDLQNIMQLSLMLIVKKNYKRCRKSSKSKSNQSDRRKDINSLFYFNQSSSLHLKWLLNPQKF